MIQNVLESVNTIDMTVLSEYVSREDEVYFQKDKKEHYRLLSAFSNSFNNANIVDIGTHYGNSALALSHNKTNTVYSFDIVSKINANNPLNEKDNIKFVISDLFTENERKEWEEILLSSALILLDTDQSVKQYEFYSYLKEKNYQGLLVCDDVWYVADMRNNFWYKIPTEYKYDATEYGHFSGTGLVTFNEDLKQQLASLRRNNDNWTLVTAYFNLTKCKDASNEICARGKEYYLSSAASTMSLDYNLVVYCDQESYEAVKKMRPSWLEHKTRYVICDFEELKFDHHDETFGQMRERIIANRVKNSYHFDNRNTGSYYLFCMSRYIMLKNEIKENHFNSTHFSWINFCIERMGYQNLIKLDEALYQKRDKFSTCYIDYIPYSLIQNTKEYYRFGRCSMCSGFFTGNAYYMNKVCDLLEKKFLHYLDLGYGHADEQLYSPVYFENPNLFEHYWGDYHEMITNYTHIYEHPEKPIYNFIRNSFDHKDYKLCNQACKKVWESYKLKKCEIPGNWIEKLCVYSMMSEYHASKS